MDIKKYKVKSSDNVHDLMGVLYIPEGEIKGLLQIIHGMTEHIGRYDRIMRELCSLGYLCFGYDQLGHGYTAKEEGNFGYIAKNRGWDVLARDVKCFSDAVRAEYGFDIPYYLMGHSMGSFVVRLSAEKHVKPDKLIVMGTGGPNPAAAPGLALISLIKLFKGDRHISKLIYILAFGSYNKKFEDGKTDHSAWLTTDREIRKKYWTDDFCSFKFTLSAMGDLIRLMKYSNRKAWFKNIPSDLPILIVSGEDDPVGDYGNGIKYVSEKLQSNGKKAHHILYKGARHEILNDFTYTDVRNDIVAFLEEKQE